MALLTGAEESSAGQAASAADAQTQGELVLWPPKVRPSAKRL